MGRSFKCDVCNNHYLHRELAETHIRVVGDGSDEYIPPADIIDEQFLCHECAYNLELFLQEIGGEVVQ